MDNDSLFAEKRTLLQLFRAAREWLSKKEHWTKGSFARNSAGKQTYTSNLGVASTCAVGAFYKEGDDGRIFAILDRLEKALPSTFIRQAGYNPVIKYNDAPERTHEEVLAWFDRAIEQQQKEEASCAV